MTYKRCLGQSCHPNLPPRTGLPIFSPVRGGKFVAVSPTPGFSIRPPFLLSCDQILFKDFRSFLHFFLLGTAVSRRHGFSGIPNQNSRIPILDAPQGSFSRTSEKETCGQSRSGFGNSDWDSGGAMSAGISCRRHGHTLKR